MIFKKKILSFINKIESSKVTVLYFIAFLYGTMVIRHCLEWILEKPRAITLFGDLDVRLHVFFGHFSFYYLANFLSIILILRLFTKEDIIKIARLVLIFFPIIFAAPILDFILSCGKGFYPSYIKNSSDLIDAVVNYLNPFFNHSKLTYGMRIETFIIIIFISTYTYLKNNSIIKALISLFTSWFVMLFWGAWPSILSMLSHNKFLIETIRFFYNGDINIHQTFFSSSGYILRDIHQQYSSLYLIFNLIFVLIISYLHFGKKLKDFLRKLKIYHSVLYIIPFLIAFVYSYNSLPKIELQKYYYSPFYFVFDNLSYVLIIISIISYWCFNQLFRIKINTEQTDLMIIHKYLKIIFPTISIVFVSIINYELFILFSILYFIGFMFRHPSLKISKRIIGQIIYNLVTIYILILIGLDIFLGNFMFQKLSMDENLYSLLVSFIFSILITLYNFKVSKVNDK